MSDFLERFNCHTNEELCQKLLEKGPDVQDLLLFLQYVKADILDKNTPCLLNPESAINYIHSLGISPEESKLYVIYTNAKARPIQLSALDVQDKRTIRKAIKEGVNAGATSCFFFTNEDMLKEGDAKAIEALKEDFSRYHLFKVQDVFYRNSEAEKCLYFSTMGERYYLLESDMTKRDTFVSLPTEDFSQYDGYSDFVKFYARNAIVGNSIYNRAIREHLKLALQHDKTESMGAILYNKDGTILSMDDIFFGTVNQTLWDINILLDYVLRFEEAKGVVLYHNHPSGETTPSPEDLTSNRTISEVCSKFFDISLADHLIVGKSGVLSMLEEELAYANDKTNYTSGAFNDTRYTKSILEWVQNLEKTNGRQKREESDLER